MKNKKGFLTMAFVGTLILGGLSLTTTSYAKTQVASTTTATQQNIITIDEANQIALKQTVNGQILKSELDTEHGILVYEIEVLENNVKKEFDIEASSGRILRIDYGHGNRQHQGLNNTIATPEIKISLEEAKKIALDNSKNGKIESIELKNKHGFTVYEVEVSEGFMEREFKIDATNGNILKMERDF